MLESIRPYLEYFSLPAGYGPAGLRWDGTGEALETDAGTYRFSREIADFLDGFAAVRPVPHFAHVVECFELLAMRPAQFSPEPERFRLVASWSRQPGNTMRNVGALFGHLCSAVPPARHVPPGGGRSLAHWLTHSPSLGHLHPCGGANPEIPGLRTPEFHKRLAAQLRQLTDFEIRHWLRHGIGPQDQAGDDLAGAIVRKPPTIGEFFDEALAERPRLGGLSPLVRHFVSALSLPPRRHTPPQLPIGGYADVTSRGDPAQLLPSQLAHDPDDFVRRYAENELLYFRREDPQEKRRDQLALVVDQGVLTWGAIRLALGAAVVAFGKLAERRGRNFTVRFSSAPGECFTPPQGASGRFADVLEASDLSAHPAQVLGEEVLLPNAVERDIVLLTHPQALRLEVIQKLSLQLARGCRLFALTTDDEGEVELVQVRAGGTTPISRFRVNFVSMESAAPSAPDVAAPYVPWSGDVENVPYPFQFGLNNRVVGLAFDAAGDRLVAVTAGGFLHSWDLRTGRVEVLPRGNNAGSILKEVEAVLGVRDGIVVAGRSGAALVAVHYDWSARTGVMHILFADAAGTPTAWHAFPHLHSIVVKAGSEYRAVDLDTGERWPSPIPENTLNLRAEAAVVTARDLLLPHPQIPIVKADHSQSPNLPFVEHDPGTGAMRVRTAQGNISFVPTDDGRPRFKGVPGVTGLLANRTLALTSYGAAAGWILHDLDNDGAALAEYARRYEAQKADLSNDGRYFAWQTNACEILVTETRGRQTVLRTAPGRCHANLTAQLGYRCLGLAIGERGLLVDWTSGELQIRRDLAVSEIFTRRATCKFHRNEGTFGAHARRFVGSYRFTNWEVGLDCFGQIAFMRQGQVTCMMMYRRGRLAVWAPSGIRIGPAELTGGPETPDALTKLGEIMRETTR